MSLVKKSKGDFKGPILPAFGIVAALEEDDRRLLSNYGEFFPIQEGQQIIQEGEEQNALYYVISGLLHVYSDRDGTRTLMGRVVWRCTRQDLEAFLSSYHEAGSRLLIGLVTNMSQRLRQMNERCADNDMLGAASSMWA